MSTPEFRTPPTAELHRVIIEPVTPATDDYRRTIVEFHNGEPGFKSHKVITVKPPKPGEEMVLGGHYHRDRELFYVLDGTISSLLLEDPASGDQQEHEQITEGTKILLPPFAAHRFIFKKPAILLAFNENPFDKNTLIPHTFRRKPQGT